MSDLAEIMLEKERMKRRQQQQVQSDQQELNAVLKRNEEMGIAPIEDNSGSLGEGVGGNIELERGIKNLDGQRVRQALESGPGLSSNQMQGAAQGGQMLLNAAGADQTAAGGVAGGALSGAAAGSMIAPGAGTAIGAGVGALAGLMKARANRKARQREAQATMHHNLGQIEQQRGANVSAAIANLMQGMGRRR